MSPRVDQNTNSPSTGNVSPTPTTSLDRGADDLDPQFLLEEIGYGSESGTALSSAATEDSDMELQTSLAKSRLVRLSTARRYEIVSPRVLQHLVANTHHGLLDYSALASRTIYDPATIFHFCCNCKRPTASNCFTSSNFQQTLKHNLVRTDLIILVHGIISSKLFYD